MNLPLQPQPANYHYDWSVVDHYTGQDFGQEEARSGYNIDGGYTVLLPDGRKQIVTYKVADAHSGYVADVRYEGEAQHYELPADYVPFTVHKTYAPGHGYAPKPAYKPAPYVAPKPAPYVAPKPAPYVAPKPVYKPAPYVAPEPVYKPAPYVPAPAPYVQRPVYAPAPPAVRTYNYKTTTLAPETTPKEVLSITTPAAPVYVKSNYKNPKMQYPDNTLDVHKAADSLFYGDLGRIRAEHKAKDGKKAL